MEELIIRPIGKVISDLKHRYETPRQGVLAGSRESVIELLPGMNFEQAVRDLEGFERIWVIYQFHLNNNWKPLVMPPRHRRSKTGVFATRAPYRPNPIGLSCVRLLEVKGLKLYISESDILDGSPVLDIKPYLPYSDSFPEASTGWAKGKLEEMFTVGFSDTVLRQISWLKERSGVNLDNFARLQLEFSPQDSSRKRIEKVDEKNFVLAYRTWRLAYSVDVEKYLVMVISVYSGYTDDELDDLSQDKYEDKEIHLEFRSQNF